MLLETELLPMLNYILKNPFTNEKLIENIKKQISKIDHDINPLLEFAFFYENVRENISKFLPEISYLLQNEYSLTLDSADISNDLDKHSIKVQIERLYDEFLLKEMGSKSVSIDEIPESYLKLINFLRINELLFLCLLGISKVVVKDNKFIFSPSNKKKEDVLYVTWFARMLDNISIDVSIQQMLFNVKNREGLYRLVFDKLFYMSFDEFSNSVFELESVRQIINLLDALMVYIDIVRKNKTYEINLNEFRKALEMAHIDNDRFNNVVDLQRQQLVTEQFLFIKDGYFRFDLVTFFYGLRNLFSCLEGKYKENVEREGLIGGDFFEKIRIKKSMEVKGSEYAERYKFLEPIYQHDIKHANKNQKYDVEYIIYDKNLEYYYFIQVKYSILGERSYFNGVVTNIQRGILEGVEQLRGVKEQLEMGNLDEMFEKRGISNITSDNSAFILVHNIPQLDFQKTNDGIALYDWNTFRNLLKNAESIIQINGKLETVRLSGDILLKDPYEVVFQLLREHEVYKEFKEKLDEQRTQISSFSLNNYEIVIQGLGI